LVEVRDAGDLGKGVFAVKDIARGTRIMSEVPFLLVQPGLATRGIKEHIEAFCAAVRALSAENLTTLDGLCCNRDLNEQTQAQAQQIIHQWHKQHGDEKGHKLNTRNLRRADKRALTRFYIWVTNRVGMRVFGDGLFALHSRINHSCSFNAVRKYNASIERLTTHASRDIKAGDQIFIEYLSMALHDTIFRQRSLKSWGFTCQCKSCTDPDEEALRNHMIDLDDGFQLYKYPYLEDSGLVRSKRVPRTTKQALEVNEEIAALFRHPKIDLQSIKLSSIYRRCAELSLDLNDMPKAIEFAQKELEVELAVLGPDSDLVNKDPAGAKYYLEHLTQLVPTRDERCSLFFL
jgi:hypothetical protein